MVNRTVLCVVLFGMGCAHKTLLPIKHQSSAEPIASTKNVNGQSATLESRVNNLLILADLEKINPTVNNTTGYVSLFGPVVDQQTRERLIAAVRSIRGVSQVRDAMYLLPASPSATSVPERNDIWNSFADSWFYLLVTFAVALTLLLARKMKRSQPLISRSQGAN